MNYTRSPIISPQSVRLHLSDIHDKYIAVVNYSEKYSILCYCNSRTGSQNIKGGQVIMVLAYYVSMCALSLVCCTIYFFIKRKYFPFRYATVFILAFLSQFCYVLLAVSKDVREALIIYKFLYIGGCFLPLAGLFMILSVCKIELPLSCFICRLQPAVLQECQHRIQKWCYRAC